VVAVAVLTYAGRAGSLPPKEELEPVRRVVAELARRLVGPIRPGSDALETDLTADLIGFALVNAAALAIRLTEGSAPAELASKLADADLLLRTGPPYWIGETFLRIELMEIRSPALRCRLSLAVDLYDQQEVEGLLSHAPLVAEDGRGLPNATSYVTVDAADTFLRRRYGKAAAPWLSATREQKERALKLATWQLNDQFRWLGCPAKPIIRPVNGVLQIRELLLSFQSQGGEVLDIGLAWDTDSSVPRRSLNRLSFLSQAARIFFPTHSSSHRAVDLAVTDMHALALFHLVKARIIDLDQDDAVRAWLLAYLRRYRSASEISELTLVGEICRNLTAAQDFRGLRTYIARTIRGLQARSHGGSPCEPKPGSVPYVAARIGMTPQALYYRIRQGTVRTEQVREQGGLYLRIPAEEQERLIAEVRETVRRRTEIRACAEQCGIKPSSVGKRLRRSGAQRPVREDADRS
jgi:hypothetical protein